MKRFLALLAGTTALAFAGAASAQVMIQPIQPMPPAPMQQPLYTSGPSWMQDDGSSSDYPIHLKGDRSGDEMNAPMVNGIPVPPGRGLPAQPGLMMR
jgi:hypothetical protein